MLRRTKLIINGLLLFLLLILLFQNTQKVTLRFLVWEWDIPLLLLLLFVALLGGLVTFLFVLLKGR